MADTSRLTVAEDALLNLLRARPKFAGVKIQGEPPHSGEDVVSPNGLLEAVWTEDAESTFEAPHFKAVVVDLDESSDLEVVIQVIRETSDVDVTAVNARLEELWNDFLDAVQNSPDLDADAGDLRCVVRSCTRLKGTIGTGEPAARRNITLEIRGRVAA